MQDDNQFHLLSHHPKSIEGDALGFGDYACTIREILLGLTAENTGLTIGIFGDWGSGKSTILRMVRELLTPQKLTWIVRFKHKLEKWRGVWYRSIGRFSAKGKRLKAYRKHWQDSKHIEPRLYRPLVVEFDAWEYSKDQIWVALLRTIIQSADESLSPWQAAWVRLRLWKRRVQWCKLAIHLIGVLFRIFIAFLLLCVGYRLIQPAGRQISWLGQFINVISTILDTRGDASQQVSWLGQFVTDLMNLLDSLSALKWLEQFSIWLEAALGLFSLTVAIWGIFSTLVKRMWQGVRWFLTVQLSLPPNLLRPTLDKDTPYVVEQFRQELLDLIHIIGRRRPIVVLIDDLDRAPIDQITPVLEAIKHFGVEPDTKTHEQLEHLHAPIAFVFAADRKAVQRAIASHYKDFWSMLDEAKDTDQFAREYLEKIVQIPFSLPPLPRSYLINLLQDADTVPPAREDVIPSLISARQLASQVLTQGPKANPRQVIQAYNTFQTVWQVVQRRNLQNIDPQLLAALVLIRYIWPETYELFHYYQELFFDLHALTTENPNELCSVTELKELLYLGCPDTKSAMVEIIQREQADLLPLLRSFALPEFLNVRKLSIYLILSQDRLVSTSGRSTESIPAALMSGDPSRIKFVDRTDRAQVMREHFYWLMEFLDPESATVELKSSTKEQQKKGDGNASSNNLGQSIEEKMVRALFALGRIGDARAAEAIAKILDAHNTYSAAVVERAIFALAHLSRRVPANVLVGKTSPTLRLRILRLLGSTSLVDSQDRRFIVRLALRDEMKIVRDTALAFAKQRGLLEEGFEELNAGPQTEQALDGYLQIVESRAEAISALSKPVKEYLIGLATDSNSPYQVRAFESLANFPQVEMAVEYMADVIVTTQGREIRKSAITKMGKHYQPTPGAPDLEWQTESWTNVEEALVDESQDVWIAFIGALDITRRKEAVDYLRKAWQNSSYARVQKAAFEALHNIADDEMNLGAAAKAQAILDEQEGSHQD